MLHVEVGLKDEEIAEGDRKVVNVRNLKVVVTRKEGKLYAFNNKCTHLGLSLKRGEVRGTPPHPSACDVCVTQPKYFSSITCLRSLSCLLCSPHSSSCCTAAANLADDLPRSPGRTTAMVCA